MAKKCAKPRQLNMTRATTELSEDSINHLVEAVVAKTCKVGNYSCELYQETCALRKGSQLLFVDGIISGTNVSLLVDTGASHSFITPATARKLGLPTSDVGASIEVRSAKGEPQLATRLAFDVPLQLGSWEGRENFTICEIDEVDLILGMTCLSKSGAVIDGRKRVVTLSCGNGDEVLRVSEMPKLVGGRINLLSAREWTVEEPHEPQFLLYVIQVKGEGDGEPSADWIKGILEKYQDVMPEDLPSGLSPRRVVDHKIEVIPGSEPPAKAPYRLSHRELVELKTQLKDLMSKGYIRRVSHLTEPRCYSQTRWMGCCGCVSITGL